MVMTQDIQTHKHIQTPSPVPTMPKYIYNYSIAYSVNVNLLSSVDVLGDRETTEGGLRSVVVLFDLGGDCSFALRALLDSVMINL